MNNQDEVLVDKLDCLALHTKTKQLDIEVSWQVGLMMMMLMMLSMCRRTKARTRTPAIRDTQSRQRFRADHDEFTNRM